MPVDCHAHWIPAGLARLLAGRSAPPRLQGNVLVTWHARRPVQPLLDVQARLQGRVQMQLLSLAPLFGVDCLPVEEALPLVRCFNEETAELCRRHPGQFAGLAALPVADTSAAVAELQRARSLGLRGAALPADAVASRRPAERLRPVFEAADAMRAHLFIHPGPAVPQAERDVRAEGTDAWLRHVALDAQARLSECVLTLAGSGFLDAYPRVSVQIANLGGTIPFLLERMQNVAADDARIAMRLRRCYVDTASFGARAVALAVDVFGIERVVFGTDCPIFSVENTLAALAPLPRATRRAILEDNPRRLLEA